ncbi:hypothetical protein LTR85_009638 [Meristemomyces frigidus]|nr:hypothetical protein LTR85_009638 [Meristemomyces frigidus]
MDKTAQSDTTQASVATMMGRLRLQHRKASTSLFLEIPVELRLVVYELLLTTNEPIDPCARCAYRGTACKDGLQPQLLRACRQMHREARTVLYGQNVFLLSLTTLYDHYSMSAWTRRMETGTFNCLRRLKLTIGTIIELPCIIKPLDYSRRVQFTDKPAFWRQARQCPKSHAFKVVEAYRARVELTINFSCQEAKYSMVDVFEPYDSSMKKPCHSAPELAAAANEGLVRNLPPKYTVSDGCTMRRFSNIVRRFSKSLDRAETPECLPRLLAGEVVPGDMNREEWQRWKVLLADLDTIKEPKCLGCADHDSSDH